MIMPTLLIGLILALQVLTLLVLGLVCWGGERLALGLARLTALLEAALREDAEAPPPPASSPRPAPRHEAAPGKCRVRGCGWPAVEDGYCEEHLHEEDE